MKFPRPTLFLMLTFVACVFSTNISIVRAEQTLIKAETFEDSLRKKVNSFLNSLTKEQQAECLQTLDDKVRWEKQYTGSKREGVQIKKLNTEQKKSLEAALRMVLSEYGWKMANSVAKQDGEQGLDKYYLACFGDPRKAGESFAIRLCEHHLTIVNLEIAEGKLNEFGPILLGANPPTLWLKDEELLMKAWKQQTEKQGSAVLLEKGKGVASQLMPANQGVLFPTLKEETQASLKQAWQHRISIFTPTIQERINALHKARGGWEKSRVAFYNKAADKRSKDGGKWDFKCGLPGMVWDYQSHSGHIHMSLCVHPYENK